MNAQARPSQYMPMSASPVDIWLRKSVTLLQEIRLPLSFILLTTSMAGWMSSTPPPYVSANPQIMTVVEIA